MGNTAGRTSLRRDGVTWTLYGLYAAYGYFLYAFGPAVPLIRDEQVIGAAVAGLHGVALATGTVIAGLLGTRIVGRWGRRRVLWWAVAGLCGGVAVFCGPALLAVTLVGAVIAGAFGTLVITVDSAALSEHHGPAAPSALAEANAAGSGVGLIAPLLVGGAVTVGLGWRAGVLVLLPLCGLLAAVAGRIALPETRLGRGPEPEAEAAEPNGRQRLSSEFWWAWGVLVLCVSLEFCLTIWCSDVLEERAGLSPGVAATGVTAIVAGLTVGRLAGSPFALRRRPEWLLYRAIAVYLAGFAVFWSSTTGWLSFVGLFVSGLGLALLFPLSLSRVIGFSDSRPDLATARSALGGRARRRGRPVRARRAGRRRGHPPRLPVRARAGGRSRGRRRARRSQGSAAGGRRHVATYLRAKRSMNRGRS